MEDSEIEKKFEELLEKKLPQILEKTEELKKRKKEEEKIRHQYVEKIWSYFPGAKTKNLKFEELKEIAEKLEELAKRVEYTPIVPKQARVKFFGDKKNRARRIGLIALLAGILVTVAVYKYMFLGW